MGLRRDPRLAERLDRCATCGQVIQSEGGFARADLSFSNSRLRRRVNLSIEDVEWIRSEHQLTVFYCADGRKFDSDRPEHRILQIAARWPHLLWVERGTIVSPWAVERFYGRWGAGDIVLRSGVRLPVARRRWVAVLRQWSQWSGSRPAGMST